jgi:hypothetical protein
MDSLPVVPASCSLDQAGLSTQLERYRAAGEGAEIIHQEKQRLVIRVSDQAPDVVIEALVAVERSCCPFLELDWQPLRRRLSIAVSRAENEPALEAIAYALGLGDSALRDERVSSR